MAFGVGHDDVVTHGQAGRPVLLHYDVDELVGDGDYFEHLLAFEEGLYLFVCQCARL
jgi:hypothetical protein